MGSWSGFPAFQVFHKPCNDSNANQKWHEVPLSRNKPGTLLATFDSGGEPARCLYEAPVTPSSIGRNVYAVQCSALKDKGYSNGKWSRGGYSAVS